MGLTDTLNSFSVGQKRVKRNTVITIYVVTQGKGNLSRRGIEGADTHMHHFSLCNAMAIRQLRATTCPTVRALDPLLVSARGPH